MPNIIRTEDFGQEAAKYIENLIRESIKSSGTCVLCLAGGKTPIPVHYELAKMDIDWSKIYITVGDERDLPPDDKDSNYKVAYDSLISRINIPKNHIFRIQTELDMEKAAETYEQELLNLQKKLGRDYLFDIVLLGIGNDGHTASLFPNSPALNIIDRLVTPNIVNNQFKERITLTYPAINSSKKIIFLAEMASKKEIIERVWAGEDLPATKVSQLGDKVTWIVGN